MSKGFVATLTEAPPLSRLAKYTVANGVLYMGLGAFLFFAPVEWIGLAVQTDAWSGQEQAWERMLAFALLVVGWFYVMGGRTGAASFALATVVDRAIVPFAMLYLWATGQAPAGMVIGIAIADPLLALGAYLIWRSEPDRP